MSSEKEYQFESISKARVGKKRGKNGKLFWEFLVRWKGYGPDEDSWEPVDSFNDMEDINHFWARCKDPRDIYDLTKFKAGEEFVPRGPPPRRSKKKLPPPEQSPNDVASTSTQQLAKPSKTPTPEAESFRPVLDVFGLPTTGKRRRGSLDVSTTPAASRPIKRQRDVANTKPSRPRPTRRTILSNRAPSRQRVPAPAEGRSNSPEYVPDSDEETKDVELQLNHVQHGVAPPSPPTSSHDPLFDESDSHTLSRRSVRGKKPLVQRYEVPSLAMPSGSLSANTRAAKSKPATSSSSKPGPGRSSAGLGKTNNLSVLTSSKRTLKTVKGSRRKPASEPAGAQQEPTLRSEVPVPNLTSDKPPKLFDLKPGDAEGLPDLDNSVNQDVDMPGEDEQRLENLQKVKDSLFPSGSTISHRLDDKPWTRSTIFGPLTMGSTIPGPVFETHASDHHAFSLNLDASTSVPVLFTDVNPSDKEIVSNIVVTFKSPPGKFYPHDATESVLNAITTEGIAARVVVSSNASSTLKDHFELFAQRLHRGDLFIAATGIQLHAFCSSSNAPACEALKISPDLRGDVDQVLVCKFIVTNYSGYADVAGKADGRLWSQYVASKA